MRLSTDGKKQQIDLSDRKDRMHIYYYVDKGYIYPFRGFFPCGGKLLERTLFPLSR